MSDLEREFEDAEEIELPEGEDAPEDAAPAEPSPEDAARIAKAEAEARKYGWKPTTEFTKPPSGWMDAERFLEHPRTQVKMLRDEIKARDARFEALERASAVAQAAAREQEAARWKAELERVKEAKRAAAQDMDLAAYDQAAERERLLEQRRAAPDVDQAQVAARLNESQARAEAQFGKEAVAAALAEAQAAIGHFNDFIPKADPYAELMKWRQTQEIARDPVAYRERIAAEERAKLQTRMSRVDGGGLAGHGRSPSSRLPAEARAAGEMFVKDGTFKSVDEYAKHYFKMYPEEAR